MAEGKKSFKLYTDQRVFFDDLPDEVAGKLIKHIFAYVNDDIPEEDFVMQLAFAPIKRQLKFDLKKWEEVCERNRKNGIKGGRPKNPKNPVGKYGLKNNPNKPDKDKDKEDNTYKKKSITLPTKSEVLKYLTDKEHFDVDEDKILNTLRGWEANGWKDHKGTPILSIWGRVHSLCNYDTYKKPIENDGPPKIKELGY